MDMGQRLKDIRTRNGLTQETLAKQLGVSRQTVYNWENGRSAPDAGSMRKLGQLYDMSLDMLLNGEEVYAQLESIVQKHRRFWQGILEIGVILELLGILLSGLEFAWTGTVSAWAGALTVSLAIVMHLYVFDHTRGQIARGLVGLAIHWTLVLGDILFPGSARGGMVIFVQGTAGLLILMAGVWTVDWKSPRLWLIAGLLLGTPLLLLGKGLQDSGALVEETPFPGKYRIEEVVYSQGEESYENAVAELGSDTLFLAMDGVERDYIGMFTYCEPNLEDTARGIWLLTPKEDESAVYRLTIEEDSSLQLSFSREGRLQWQWRLIPDHRQASISVATFGHTTFKTVTWYPKGTEDPLPHFGNSIDVVMNAKLTINTGGMEEELLTVYEEYHHGTQTDYQTHSLEPQKKGSFSMPLKVRYEGVEEQYAVYRIPFEGGEYRFVLTFAGI